eukprot:TRINITY_DN8567_c0_g1_i1.p1 TRINITY_DN8567_c0_g1~~TRINITY_DN8567_c0_g1_i1.p1  ORF type:complete len:369 (+),score=85.27 TRINITY_DN8567_c0_g1_i1:25-1131(+)
MAPLSGQPCSRRRRLLGCCALVAWCGSVLVQTWLLHDVCWVLSPKGGAGRCRIPRSAAASSSSTEVATALGEAEPESLLPELLSLAAGDSAALEARIEEEFARISPEDLSELHMKAGNADSDDHEAARAVGAALQKSLHSRLGAATEVLTDLIENSQGDVNQRVRKTLKSIESPLPVLMVLQLNIAQAQQKGDAEYLKVLMHLNTVISEELEKKLSRVRGLLNKLLRIEDEGIRNNILRHHLEPMEVPGAPDLDGDGGDKLMAALVPPSRLAPAISQLVRDVDRQMVAVLGPDDDARYETMERIRQVAKQARLVIGEVYGEGEMNTFGADLTPAFSTLMAYKARNLPTPSADAEGGAPSEPSEASPEA